MSKQAEEESVNLWIEHPNPIVKYLEKGRRKKIIEAVLKVVKENDRCLDLGCGDGYLAQQILRERKVKILGVDLDKQLLKNAQETLKKESFSTCYADVRKIPLKEKFDVVYSGCILSHVKDPEKIIKEIHRLTKKNARVIIQIPNDDVLLKIKKIVKTLGLSFLFPGIRMGLAKAHLIEFNLKKLRKLLENKFLIRNVNFTGILFLPIYYMVSLQRLQKRSFKKLKI